ncbi:hypothetical protein NP233_g1950 [Leucocoprinus birnbaumii]|uniref:Uncharacterized protein n=1 Tax=Leucocoprinus birnbaumii TaxID=56174 RepID=A0AAD5VZP0_9AGAR|nr:hypothetical protein NP233_g1950 [Leucocoprinus birnbaumii]
MSHSPSLSRSPSSFSSLEEENIALKRKISELEKQIEESGTKRKLSSSLGELFVDSLPAMKQQLCSLGKLIGVLLQMQREYRILPSPMMKWRWQEHMQDRCFSGYCKLIEIAPHIAELLRMMDTEKKLAEYLEKLESGINSSRTDDNSHMKWKVAGWINNAFKPQDHLKLKSCSNRGLQHNVCGRLLTPIEVDWDDLDICEAIRSGTSDFNINESYFLHCFYPDGQVDPNNVEHNFLHSCWLLLAFHAIFISPSVDEDDYTKTSEDEPPHKKHKCSAHSEASKSNVASRIGMNGRVTGCAIAYTAVILVFNLTDASR